MKKILYVINHFRSGAIPNILKDIIPYLRDDFEIEVLVLDDIRDQKLATEFFNQGIKVSSLKTRKFNFFKTYILLKKKFHSEFYHIIHSHLGRSDFYSSMACPDDSILITTFHSERKNYPFLIRLSYYLTDRKVDFRTSVSQSVQDSWYKNGIMKSKSKVIYNPVALEKFKYESNQINFKTLGISKEDYIIVNVGNIRHQKGQIYLLKAINKLIKNNDISCEICVLLVGRSSNAQKEITEYIRKNNLEPYVKMLGFQRDVSKILAIADLFVFPSISEGLGIAVLEAMASKTPVIASKLDSLEEYLIDGYNALLFEPKDSNGLAEKIKYSIENPNIMKKIGQNGQTTVKTQFPSKRIGNQYRALYLYLLRKEGDN